MGDVDSGIPLKSGRMGSLIYKTPCSQSGHYAQTSYILWLPPELPTFFGCALLLETGDIDTNILKNNWEHARINI